MTRRDYVAIAAALVAAHNKVNRIFTSGAQQTARVGVNEAADHIADVMARDNPRFDRARFLKNAGVQS